MRETADILQISKSIKLVVKIKKVSFILRQTVHKLSGQPDTRRRDLAEVSRALHAGRQVVLAQGGT